MTTNRRDFIASAGAAAAFTAWPRIARSAAPALALPTPVQQRWADLEIGTMLTIAPNTWQNKESDDLTTPLSDIDPDIDTDQWVDATVASGGKYVIMVAKHAGGFCWWQTNTTDYSVKNIPWRGGKGDVMADLQASCDRRGVRLAVYLSPRDDRHGATTGGRCATPAQQSAYNALYREQLTELLTRYGPMVEVWFDGSCVVPVHDLLERYASNAMIFQGPDATIRWVGDENGYAPYPAWNALKRADAETGTATAAQSDPNGDRWLPLECDVSIRRPFWFWNTTNLQNLLSLDDMLLIYYRTVGRGALMMLGLAPDTTGHVPQPDAQRCAQFGTEISRRFGQSVAQTSGSGNAVTLTLPSPQLVDHAIVQEDIAYGERVRSYRIDGRANGSDWVTLGTGTAIGHKRIQPIPPTRLAELRLVCTEAAAPPRIRLFAAYATGSAPPTGWNA